MLNNYKLDNKVINNFSNTRLSFLFPAVLLLFVIIFMLLKESVFNVNEYVETQKDLFFYFNSRLSKLPNLQFNLTQLGNPIISLPLLTVFILYAPKLWDAVLTSSIIGGLLSILLKRLFAIPRPAAMFDNDSFVIIGKTLASTHSSMPSGHSIIIFIIITILLFAFMPKELKLKIFLTFFILTLGLIIAFSRVGIGAHYPLDVVIGSAIGYISAVVGIVINNNVSWWTWLKNKKYYPILILLLTIWILAIISEIIINNLLIFYFSLIALIITLYLIIDIYAKK